LFLLKLTARTMPPLQIARLCQRAEHRFAGVQSGLLDQVSSIFGQADHAVFFDCRSEEVRTIPFPADLALIIAQSGTKRELRAGKYNERRAETAAAAQALGVGSLRDVSMTMLDQHVDLAPTLRRRAAHVIGENERVWEAVALLEANDGVGFGALMNASHESSRVNFENSTEELDLLVDLARSFPGVLGARLTGGGFGGATVTLCRRPDAADIARRLATAFRKKTGSSTEIFVCRVADGAMIQS
jgi:galactokinase